MKKPLSFSETLCFSPREPVESKRAFICTVPGQELNSTPLASYRSAAAARNLGQPKNLLPQEENLVGLIRVRQKRKRTMGKPFWLAITTTYLSEFNRGR
jgi:hypothetical protein